MVDEEQVDKAVASFEELIREQLNRVVKMKEEEEWIN